MQTKSRQSHIHHYRIRSSSILNQTIFWNTSDLKRKLEDFRKYSVPLNAEALVVLRQQVGKHTERVFTFRGRPVHKAGTKAWRAALQRAGIQDFRWHDLRHTWASWHVQAGTPLHALQELGGWESAEMVRRYAHLSSEHLADYAEMLAQPRLVRDVDTNLAHA